MHGLRAYWKKIQVSLNTLARLGLLFVQNFRTNGLILKPRF